MWKKRIKGRYFKYCQFCSHDGVCELLHCEFMGAKNSGKIIPSRKAFDHENLTEVFSMFQYGNVRQFCAGRICATGSTFYPLQCECGTVINSMRMAQVFGGNPFVCAKFSPNEKFDEFVSEAQKDYTQSDGTVDFVSCLRDRYSCDYASVMDM